MSVHYDMTEEDWAAMQLHYAQNTGQMKRGRLAFYVMGALLLVMGAALEIISTRTPAGLIFFAYAIFLMAMGFFLPKISRRNVLNLLRRGHHKALFGSSSVTLTPKGIQATSPIAESVFYWNAVEKLAETDTHLFVQFSAGVNLIVPKRAFATQTHGTQFLKLAEEYRQAATGTPIPTTQKGAWWTQGSSVVETQSQRQ